MNNEEFEEFEEFVCYMLGEISTVKEMVELVMMAVGNLGYEFYPKRMVVVEWSKPLQNHNPKLLNLTSEEILSNFNYSNSFLTCLEVVLFNL